MGPWYYEVVSFDGDYVNLRRTDIASDELNPVALALLPPEIEVGSKNARCADRALRATVFALQLR